MLTLATAEKSFYNAARLDSRNKYGLRLRRSDSEFKGPFYLAGTRDQWFYMSGLTIEKVAV